MARGHSCRQACLSCTLPQSPVISRNLLIRYLEWDEEARIAWLSAELVSPRPLIPDAGTLAADERVKEVLATFALLATLPPECLGAYCISMARSASDVLAVRLLQVERRVRSPLLDTSRTRPGHVQDSSVGQERRQVADARRAALRDARGPAECAARRRAPLLRRRLQGRHRRLPRGDARLL